MKYLGKNPYADKINEEVTLGICKNTMDYFREVSEKTGIPVQVLINSTLWESTQKEQHK